MRKIVYFRHGFLTIISMKNLTLFCLLLLSTISFAQDKSYARVVIDTLTSDNYAGRGYVKNGHLKAADFIAKEFNRFGLERFDSDFKQEYQINVNTFGGNADVFIDKNPLLAGIDFLVHPSCPSVSGEFKLKWLNHKIVGNPKKMGKFMMSDLSDVFLIIDTEGIQDSAQLAFMNDMVHNPFKAKGILIVQSAKLTWSMSQTQKDYPIIYINKTQIKFKNKKITLDIQAKLKKDEITQNVIGYVKGKEQPDSFLVFSAHYDHLGMLGPDATFYGANDNASGTALLLNLASHYSKPENQPKYSILFIAFGAEEVGLLGSKHYVNKPYFPLEKIKFLINVDIMGTGDEGITVVNGAVHQKEFDLLSEINEKNGYLDRVKKRGKAANSDHHWFDQKGVKSIFIYTMGGSKAYHDIQDSGSNLTLLKYNQCFQLITDFITTYK